MNKPKILIVEDETLVAQDIGQQLLELGYEPVAETNTGEEAILLCGQLQPDLVLMDIQLAGAMDGIAAAQIIRGRFSIAVVFLTALSGDAIINQAKLTEPFGYIIKPFDERELRTVIEMALYKHGAGRELKKSEERHRTIVEHSGEGIGFVNAEERFEFANRAAEEIFGVGSGGLVGLNLEQFVSAEQYQLVKQKTALRVHDQKSVYELEVSRPNGGKRSIIVTTVPQYDHAGVFVGTHGIFRDITQQKQAEDELRRTSQWLFATQRISAVGGWSINLQTGAVWVSPEARHIYGYRGDGELTIPIVQAFPLHQYRPALDRALKALVEEGKPYDLDFQIARICDGVIADIHSVAEYDAAKHLVVGVVQDITARKHAEAEKAKLEAQFQQAQKMESVGRLAGGVAHDFNNMLQVILANTDMALGEIPPDSPLRESLQEVRNCAGRSADLTRQLLAFARRQTIAPKVLDLNETVGSMLKLLRRLIGDDIDLTWLPAQGLGLVKMDPTQVDQILANLCVNARDAIEGVGKVTIETANIVFDAAYCADHPGYAAGEYVRLAVSDNGCGMDKATVAQIFEPFFTTKGLGEGTGLGLATVYGIVKQNHGFINVYSEPGHGTTFTLYLPRHAGEAAATGTATAAKPQRSSGETVLLVEDEPAVLTIARMILERLGYAVLTAGTPSEAIRLAGAHAGEIHLLITDVVMPEMNGLDLEKRLLSLHPKLKCLFMSGYTANVIAHHGVLKAGVNFIQKPFSMGDLATKVRTTLEG